MGELWYDYSTPGADLTGIPGVMRYLRNGLTGGRTDLTAAEVASLQAAGKDIGLIWEKGITAASQGRDRGIADAQAANTEADRLGAPSSVAIFYAVDNDYTPTQVAAYFDGVRSVVGRPVGIYGSFAIVEWAASVGIAWRWMAGAWNYGKGVSKYAHLYQRDSNVPSGSTKVDRNVWLAPFPAWTAGGTVALTPDDIAAVAKAVLDSPIVVDDKGGTVKVRDLLSQIPEVRRLAGVPLEWSKPVGPEVTGLAKLQAGQVADALAKKVTG